MYKIPKDDLIARTIKEILDGHKEVGSQEALHRMVAALLNRADAAYKVSPERLRRIAAGLEDVVIRVEKMRAARRAKACYVCGGEMKLMKARDLFGRETVAGRKCSRCGFELERNGLAPRRYIFIKR